MKRFLAATAFLVVALGVIAITDSASAKDSILNSFTATYPATSGTRLDSCSTCHTSVPALNSYGLAVQAAGLNFSSIEGRDSDGDGFTNLQEIRSLTNPGSASDRPTTTTSTSTTSTSTTSTTSATGATDTTGTTSTTSTTSATVAAAAVAPATLSGAVPYDVKGVGTVWLAVEDGRLVVKNVEVVDTSWKYFVENDHDDDNEIEVKFRSGDKEVEFEAEFEDGSIRTKVEFESDHDDDGRDHDDDDDRRGRSHDDDDDDDDHRGRDHDDEDDDDKDDHDDDD